MRAKALLPLVFVVPICVLFLFPVPAEARYQDGLNLYEYVRGMPTMLVDPLGQKSQNPMSGPLYFDPIPGTHRGGPPRAGEICGDSIRGFMSHVRYNDPKSGWGTVKSAKPFLSISTDLRVQGGCGGDIGGPFTADFSVTIDIDSAPINNPDAQLLMEDVANNNVDFIATINGLQCRPPSFFALAAPGAGGSITYGLQCFIPCNEGRCEKVKGKINLEFGPRKWKYVGGHNAPFSEVGFQAITRPTRLTVEISPGNNEDKDNCDCDLKACNARLNLQQEYDLFVPP